MTIQAMMATKTLGKPSTINNSLHGAIGLRCPRYVIAHAKLLAKDDANGAAAITSPVLKASSSLL
jgi:hypothetical protein